MTEIPPFLGRLVKGSLLLFPVFWVLFWLGTAASFWSAMYLALLIQLLPAMAIAQLPLVDQDEALPRVPVYLSSSALILGIGFLGLWVGGKDPGIEVMGLGPQPLATVIPWSLGLSGAALLLLVGFLLLRRAAGIQESPLLARLLPKTVSEKGLFVVLSLSAGFGEEIAYRGFLVPVLTGVIGLEWVAALLSSVVFGLLHAYQGWLGIVRTGALGMALAASFLLSGTLWPAIIAHAFLDVVGGVFLGDVFLKE